MVPDTLNPRAHLPFFSGPQDDNPESKHQTPNIHYFISLFLHARFSSNRTLL